MESRDELVGESVEHGKAAAEELKALGQAAAKLGVEEARETLAPAAPALRRAGIALGAGVAGGVLVLLPVLSVLARQRLFCGVLGGALVGLAVVQGRQALQEMPPDLKGRVRRILSEDMKQVVDEAGAPAH